MTKEKIYSPSEIAFIRDTISQELKLAYRQLLFECMKEPDCLVSRDDTKTTENNLINSIIFEGQQQLGAQANFTNVIVVGASTIAKSLGLL
jgi:hypothetical protein